MTNVFEVLWNSSPQAMSVLIIIAILVFITFKLTMFFAEFKNLSAKVDSIIEFLTNKFGK